jgi:tetratricopeptide (TPR) repeat protein
MSKRSSRRKRQEHQKKLEARLTAPVLAQQGRQTFQQADYTTAIKDWEHARQKPNPPPALAAALAEAYFRRALSQPPSSLADLQQAVKLQPQEPRYRYHLALTYHRQGALVEAEPLYRQLLAETPPFTRAAAPLIQVLIEQKKAVAIDPAWLQLNPVERTELAVAEALVRQTMSTLPQLVTASLHPFWRGLAAMALHDIATAQQCLHPLAASTAPLSPQLRSVARYYLGVMAAAVGQTETALAHWQAAQADGLDSPYLSHNLAAAVYAQALKAQQAGQPQ